MARESLNDIKRHKDFYKNYFRKSIVGLLIVCLITVGLILVIAYTVVSRPAPHYYTTNTSGLIRPLTGLRKANQSPQPLLKPDPARAAPKQKVKI